MTDFDIPEVHALFLSGREIGDWVWCLHCQRCYKIGEYRIEKKFDDLQMCPYDGCDGDTVFDSIEWRGECEPVRGKIYDYTHKPAE